MNCIPVFIASNDACGRRSSRTQGSPVIGDDIKAQVGATILHRTLTNLFLDRGMRIIHTYQLNTGGNTDFLNMLERERLTDKKTSKTEAVTSMIEGAGSVDRPRGHPCGTVRLRAVAEGQQGLLPAHRVNALRGRSDES